MKQFTIFILFILALQCARAEDLISYKSDSLTIIGLGRIKATQYLQSQNAFYTLSENGSIYKWNLNTTEWERFYGDLKSRIACFAISPDGTKLAVTPFDSTIRIIDMTTNTEIKKIQLPQAAVFVMNFNYNGSILAYGQYDIVDFIVVNYNDHIEPITGFIGDVTSILFSKDKNRIVTGTINAGVVQVKIVEREQNLIWSQKKVFAEPSYQLITKLSEDGKLLGICYSRRLDIYTFDSLNLVNSIKFNNQTPSDFELNNASGKVVLTFPGDSSLKIFNIQTGVEVKSTKSKVCSNIICLEDSAKSVIVKMSSDLINRYDLNNAQKTDSFVGHSFSMSAVNFFDNKSQIISAFNNKISFIDYLTGKVIHQLPDLSKYGGFYKLIQ